MKKKQKTGQASRRPVLVPSVFILSISIFFYFVFFDHRILFYRHIGNMLFTGAALVFVSACAFGAGDILLSRFKKIYHSKIEHFLIVSSVGFAALTYLTFLMGAANLLHPFAAVVLIAVIFLFSVNRIRNFFKKAENALTSAPRELLDIYEISVISIIGLAAAIYFLKCFTPPLHYDTLAYHLAVPKLFMEEGGIRFIPNNVYANFPMNMEFLFMLGMLLKDDTLARLFHFASGILAALAVYSFTAKHFTRKTALTAAAAFFTIPKVGLLSGWAFNELLLTLYILLSVFCFSEWAKNKKFEHFLLSAVFCGLAIGTKYTALLLLLPFLLAGTLIKLAIDRETKKEIVKKVLTAAGISLLVPLPWFIKNAVYTYNPVYPFLHGFFNSIFPHPAVESFDMARFVQQHTPGAVTALQAPKIFFRTLMNLQLGPFFAAFLPFLLFGGNFKKFETKILLLYFLSYFLLWTFFTHQYPRFFITAAAFLAIPVSHAIITSARSSRHLNGLIQAFVAAVFLINLAWTPFEMARHSMPEVIFGISSREEFLTESGLYQYPAFSFINEELPEEAKILFIGENQTYYVDRETVSNSPLDSSPFVNVVNESRTVPEIIEKLKTMGITHILYNASETRRTAEAYDAFRWKDWRKERLFFRFISDRERLEEIFSRGGVFIWELG